MKRNHALLEDVLKRGSRYLSDLPQRRVAPSQSDLDGLSRFDMPLPEYPTDAVEVLAELDEAGSPATIASAGGRYFGFIIGSSLPAAYGSKPDGWCLGSKRGAGGIVTCQCQAGRRSARLAGGPVWVCPQEPGWDM